VDCRVHLEDQEDQELRDPADYPDHQDQPGHLDQLALSVELGLPARPDLKVLKDHQEPKDNLVQAAGRDQLEVADQLVLQALLGHPEFRVPRVPQGSQDLQASLEITVWLEWQDQLDLPEFQDLLVQRDLVDHLAQLGRQVLRARQGLLEFRGQVDRADQWGLQGHLGQLGWAERLVPWVRPAVSRDLLARLE